MMQSRSLRVRRVEPGSYIATFGRGVNRRTFEISKVGAGDPDGWESGWRVIETEIGFLTIKGGWTSLGAGLPNKAAAVALAESEIGR